MTYLITMDELHLFKHYTSSLADDNLIFDLVVSISFNTPVKEFDNIRHWGLVRRCFHSALLRDSR